MIEKNFVYKTWDDANAVRSPALVKMLCIVLI